MAKETLASMLDDFINEQLNQIVLSNPVEKKLLQKVKVRPMLMKGALVFQAEEFTKTQAFHKNMNAEEAKAYLTEQLSDRKLGDRLLIPCNMLRSGENVFLDDITVTELSEKLGREIIVVDPAGADLVSAVLDSTENKKQIRRQMYEQTGSGNSGQA